MGRACPDLGRRKSRKFSVPAVAERVGLSWLFPAQPIAAGRSCRRYNRPTGQAPRPAPAYAPNSGCERCACSLSSLLGGFLGAGTFVLVFLDVAVGLDRAFQRQLTAGDRLESHIVHG